MIVGARVRILGASVTGVLLTEFKQMPYVGSQPFTAPKKHGVQRADSTSCRHPGPLTTKREQWRSGLSGALGSPFRFSLKKNLSLQEKKKFHVLKIASWFRT